MFATSEMKSEQDEEVRPLTVRDSGIRVIGTRNNDNGEVTQFVGYLHRNYTQLARATGAARRKYKDSTINVLNIEPYATTYNVDANRLSEISIADGVEVG